MTTFRLITLAILIGISTNSAFSNTDQCIPENAVGYSQQFMMEGSVLVGLEADHLLAKYVDQVKVTVDAFGKPRLQTLWATLKSNQLSYEYASGCFTYKQAILQLHCVQTVGLENSTTCGQYCQLNVWSDDCR